MKKAKAKDVMLQEKEQETEGVSRTEELTEWETLMNAGHQSYSRRRYSDAEVKFGAALKIAESWSGLEDFEQDNELMTKLAKSLNNMGALFHTQGKYEMALEHYRRALELQKKMYGDMHEAVGVNLHNIAIAYCARSKFDEAEPILAEALKIKESVHGPDHPELISTLMHFSMLMSRTNRSDEAKKLEERIETIKNSASHQ